MRILSWTLALLVVVATTARAQGVYTAAVQGTVRNAQNQPLPNATVLLTNQATGDRWSAVSTASGRFAIENVPVGGPYALLARVVGYAPAQQNGIQLVLGQRLDADLTLQSATVKLETVQVTASKSPLQDITRTGESTTISDSAVHSLPTIDRDFQGFLETAPQVSFATGGMSIAGQNTRLNNILIDGSVNNDLFGLADNGLPGGQVGGRAISLEAVDQLQLQVAPYDVRLGGFTGGLLNVVTKSGTNRLHGSAFEYFRNQSLVGSDIFGQHIADFSEHQWGASVGGPIVPDRAHFFVSFEQRSTNQPVLFVGPNDAVNQARLGYTLADVTAISNRLTALGVKPGSFGPASLGNPNPDVFAKVDFQITPGNTITLSENYITGYDDFLDRGNVNSSAYDLSSAGHRIKNYNTDTRLDWSANFGGIFANDLILSAGVVRDKRDPASNYATIDIFQGNSGDYLAGAEEFSEQNRLYQTVDEITDNLTAALGDHHVTIGTHDELYHFHNEFFPQSFGRWRFNSVADFLAGKVKDYNLATPLAAGGPTADFAASQVGFYVQDQWNPVQRLSLSGGVRFDVPIIPDKPGVDQKLLTESGISTAQIPSNNLEISPRIGFNYDVLGDRSTVIRGGTGLFQGRSLFVWISNAFSNTGANQTLLTCRGASAPAFTAANLASPPTSCAGAAGSPPIPTVNYFDNSVSFPQNWRTSLGFDRDLGHGFFFSLDGLYNVAEHQLYIEDVNIRVRGTLAGEGGRPIYGVPDGGNQQTDVTHVYAGYGPILHHVNRSGDYSYSITPQINKTFGQWLLGRYAELHASYTYQQSYDRMSLSSSIAESNYGFSEISGTSTIFNRPLEHSEFETPHQIKITAMNVFPLGFKGTLFYVGRSGNAFAYAVNGDVSGLGSSRSNTHDLIYVPKNKQDITLSDNQGNVYTGAQQDSAWNQLNSYINSQSCLANARGQVMRRSACRNPWQDIINARIAKDFTVRGQTLELSWDVFNLPNLINRNWGQYKQITPFEDADLFSAQGFDSQHQRFVYNFSPINKTTVTDPTINEGSVWRMQVGVHYSF